MPDLDSFSVKRHDGHKDNKMPFIDLLVYQSGQKFAFNLAMNSEEKNQEEFQKNMS